MGYIFILIYIIHATIFRIFNYFPDNFHVIKSNINADIQSYNTIKNGSPNSIRLPFTNILILSPVTN